MAQASQSDELDKIAGIAGLGVIDLGADVGDDGVEFIGGRGFSDWLPELLAPDACRGRIGQQVVGHGKVEDRDDELEM